ncbi:MAG: stage II sporulation protein M [Lactobacillales bacterium]|jgi:hypothetical protein|nr:stage II sporulation protein M [Lactobacillales bacterium]
MFKEIRNNCFLFFLPTLLCGVFIFINGESNRIIEPKMFPSFIDIVYNNFIILIFLIMSGCISCFFPYCILFFNSITLSIFILIYGNYVGALCRIFPYGILEVLGYSIGCYTGTHMREHSLKLSIQLSVVAGFILLISAIIESLIIKGVS